MLEHWAAMKMDKNLCVTNGRISKTWCWAKEGEYIQSFHKVHTQASLHIYIFMGTYIDVKFQ